MIPSENRYHPRIKSEVPDHALEPRNIRERDTPGMHMDAAELGATMQRREHFAGIEQALVVEGAFEALLRIKIDFGEHYRHQVALFHADAVLAGEHAADFDAQPQNIGAELLGALQFAGFVGVVENERV